MIILGNKFDEIKVEHVESNEAVTRKTLALEICRKKK